MPEDLNAAARRSLLLSLVFDQEGRLSPKGVALTLMPFPLLSILVIIGASADGSLYLDGPAVGLFEHYGFLTYMIITPLALLLAALILRETLTTLTQLEKYTTVATLPTPIRTYRDTLAGTLALRGNSKFLLLLFVLVGVLCSAVNIAQTIEPSRIYGNDVFDAFNHPWGFFFAKLYIFLTWSLVYPLCIYLGLHSGLLLPVFLGAVVKRGILQVNLFHMDNCGGMSRFGRLNVLTMLLQLGAFLFLYALYNTHAQRTYATMTVPLFLFSVVFILQSVLGVLHIQRAVTDEKKKALERVAKELSDHFSSVGASAVPFPSGLLGLREHLLKVHSHPYSGGIQIVVNFLRFAPSVAGLLRLFRI